MFKHCFLLVFIFFHITLATSATPLQPNQAFHFETNRVDPNTFIVQWKIKPGYFLYQKSIEITKDKHDSLALGQIQYPKPQIHVNRQGQQQLVYRDQLSLRIPVLSQKAGEPLIMIHFQGCSDEGFCYPPMQKQLKLTFNTEQMLSQVLIEPPPEQLEPLTKRDGIKTNEVFNNHNDNAKVTAHSVPTSRGYEEKPEQLPNFKHLFSSHHWFIVIMTFFGFGLLISFTPCILPMIPVLSSIIIGHGQTISARKAFFLSLSYVLSMSITYGVIGSVFALLGHNLQVVMQSTLTICLFSLVFVLLALSMFGFYDLRLPVAWQNRLANITRSRSNGHYLSAAIMGCLSTLILSPCVTAPMIGALSYIAQTGDMILGLLTLFFLGLGIGTPLLLIGASAGKLLPKVGAWMNAVKAFFGILLLGVAINLLSRVASPFITMILWAFLAIFTGISLKPFGPDNQNKLKQGLGVVLLSYGLFILYGASAGHTNPLKPLMANQPQASASTLIVRNLKEAKQALNAAKHRHQPVMVDFYADWCVSCKLLTQTTLQDGAVLTALKQFQWVIVDLTKNNQDTQSLIQHFNVVAPPTFLFYDAGGNRLSHLMLVGDISADHLLGQLKETIKSNRFTRN